MKDNSTTEHNFEYEEGLSEMSSSICTSHQEISKIYTSNLEHAYKLIDECSQTSRVYQSKVSELQQLNRHISNENLELKQKLQELEKESKKIKKEETSNTKDQNESSKISTFWQYDSILDSETSYELETRHNNTLISLRTQKNMSRKASYPIIKLSKKKPVIKTALIKSVFFNF